MYSSIFNHYWKQDGFGVPLNIDVVIIVCTRSTCAAFYEEAAKYAPTTGSSSSNSSTNQEDEKGSTAGEPKDEPDDAALLPFSLLSSNTDGIQSVTFVVRKKNNSPSDALVPHQTSRL